MVKTRFLVALALAGSFLLPACTRPKVVDPSKVDHPAQGAWGMVERGQDARGDEYLDAHEVLVRADTRGWTIAWDRARTWKSSDTGRVFREGRSERCTVAARAMLRGKARKDGKVVLERTAKLPREQRCVGSLPFPRSCSLAAAGNELRLECGKRQYVFSRQRDVSPALLFALLAPGGRVSGVWTWHHRSIDREGDLKIETETWHLFQRGKRVEGFYDREVAVRSRDGRRFLCNDGLGYNSRARFLIRGKVVGDQLHLREVSYVTKAGRCDTGRRTLDRYVGVLQGRDGLINLRWRTGGQLLRRRR